MAGPYYAPDAANDAHVQAVYGRDGITRRNVDTKKRVDSSRPFQGDVGGVGIGGKRRKNTIDQAVDDMS